MFEGAIYKHIFGCKKEELTDNKLKPFIPDVYQEDIYHIRYELLRAKGIKVISFDIDNTISDNLLNVLEANIPDEAVKKAVKKVEELKKMGFKVALLSNVKGNSIKKYKKLANKLGVDHFVPEAEKPSSKGFKEIANEFGVTPFQMAHIGNDIYRDIGGGSKFGATTCLVRRNGFFTKVERYFSSPYGRIIRKELKERKLWYEHHGFEDGDQYYQLNEKPTYKK